MILKRTSRHGRHSAASEFDVLFARASKQWDSGKLRSAFRLFLSTAKRGDPSAQHNLGYFYDTGVGVKPNRRKALYWYKRAFSHGYRTAASNIATIFRDEKNTKKALAWFERAVKLGDADANVEIAKIYLMQEKDVAAKAVACLKRAVKAKTEDLTSGSRDEAKRLLRQLSRGHDRRVGQVVRAKMD